MYAPRFGGKRKDHNRNPRVSRRHEISVVYDAVRRSLELEIFAEAIAAFYPEGKDRATLEILETSRRLS